jgi:hypothetical protein
VVSHGLIFIFIQVSNRAPLFLEGIEGLHVKTLIKTSWMALEVVKIGCHQRTRKIHVEIINPVKEKITFNATYVLPIDLWSYQK